MRKKGKNQNMFVQLFSFTSSDPALNMLLVITFMFTVTTDTLIQSNFKYVNTTFLMKIL